MDFKIIAAIVLFVILVSIQYTLNKILSELRNIKRVLEKKKELDAQVKEVEKRI